MEVRNATIKDLTEILNIYAYARQFMRDTGNPNQWKTTNPTQETLESDISNGNLYLLVDSKEIHGVFAYIEGIDPTYNFIEGKWLNDMPYSAVHRVASAGKSRGVLKQIMDYALSCAENIRIDTHEDNKVMQHSLEKLVFVMCGIIYLSNGEPRIAYHIVNNKRR